MSSPDAIRPASAVAASGVGSSIGKGMGVAFADFDGDGLLDAFTWGKIDGAGFSQARIQYFDRSLAPSTTFAPAPEYFTALSSRFETAALTSSRSPRIRSFSPSADADGLY